MSGLSKDKVKNTTKILAIRYKFILMKHQFSSVAQLCPTLCDRMDYSTPGFQSITSLQGYSNKSSFPVQCNFAFKIFVWSTWNVLHSHYSQAFHQAELRFTGVLHGLLVWICDALRFSYFVKPLWFYNTMGQLLKFRDLLVLYKFMSRIILYYKHCERCIFFENCIWYTL